MSELVELLKSFGVTPKQTVNTAIRAIGNRINESSSPESMAKKIVISLGGTPLGSKVEDVILAKALVEQAVTNIEKYDAAAAFTAAQAKLDHLKQTRPWAFTQEGAPVTKESVATKKSYYKPKTNRRKGDNNDKLKVAAEIFEANKTLKRGEIVAKVQEALSISYANAYYYVKTLEKKAAV